MFLFGQWNDEIKQLFSYPCCTYWWVPGRHSDWCSQASYWSGRLAPGWTPSPAPDSFLLHLVHLWAQRWSIHTATETHSLHSECTFGIKMRCEWFNTSTNPLINISSQKSRTRNFYPLSDPFYTLHTGTFMKRDLSIHLNTSPLVSVLGLPWKY